MEPARRDAVQMLATFSMGASAMTVIAYKIVEHDGGWAYKLGDVFSETFPTHQAAVEAAKMVAAEQQMPGRPRRSNRRTTKGNGTRSWRGATTGPIAEVIE